MSKTARSYLLRYFTAALASGATNGTVARVAAVASRHQEQKALYFVASSKVSLAA